MEFINDASYVTTKYVYLTPTQKKRTWICPFFSKWVGIKSRVTNPKKRSRCCEEWLLYSNFESWIRGKDFQGKELDKDLICFLKGIPKIYSPSTCLFLSRALNTTLPSIIAYIKGDIYQGVWYDEERNTYQARVRFKGKREFLGRFGCKDEAATAWKSRKLEILNYYIATEPEEVVVYLEKLKEIFVEK